MQTIFVLWFLTSGTWPIESFANFNECKSQAQQLNANNTPQRGIVFTETINYGKYLCLPAGVHPYQPQKRNDQ